MATYTVNLTGDIDIDWAYAELNGTAYDEENHLGTHTFESKPTIEVYVSSSRSSLRSRCKVTLNGTTVKSGYGWYTADIGDADTVNIKFNAEISGGQTYYTCDITTETSTPPDPMAPHDGHNTNIGQVARQIEGGTALIGGVLREFESGLALVGGVSREIELVGRLNIKIVTSPYNNSQTDWPSVTINGQTYYRFSPDTTIEVEPGTEISFYLSYTAAKGSYLYVNGVQVAKATGTSYPRVTHPYTVTKSITIDIDGSKIYVVEE